MKKLLVWLLMVFVVGGIFVTTQKVAQALSQSELQDFAQNDILFYNPSCADDSGGGSCVGLLPGDNNAERVWNYFVEAGISGVSDNANVISGIMGNLKQESNFNPFSAGNYYGLFQTNNEEMLNEIKEAGLDKYWGDNAAPKDAIEKAIRIELDWLTKKANRFICAGDPTWEKTGFLCNIDKTNDTPEAYSDLFLVSYEDATTSEAESPNMGGSNAILDKHAREVGREITGDYSYYQEAEVRRNNAEAISKEYASAVTCKGSQAIVETAKRLAWAEGARPADIYTATDDYNKAALARGDGFVYAPGSCTRLGSAGICYSCARFASLVLLESGVDPDFVEKSKLSNGNYRPHLLSMSSNPEGLTYYLTNSPKWREVTEYKGNGYEGLEPGDILLSDNEYRNIGKANDHVFIYLGDGKVADASHEDFGAYQHDWSDFYNGWIAFRLKNSGGGKVSNTITAINTTEITNGDTNNILRAKNADKQYSDFIRPNGAINAGKNVAYWDDYDSPEMLKMLLETYGDLAYQVQRAIGVPWIAVLVQMRYEDPNSVCGKNNFWGAGCPPGTGPGGASIWGDNLGDGFLEYAKALTNGYHDQALGISDPKEFLVKLGPTWVQGNIHGAGYGSIEGMKKSVDVLGDFVKTNEGKAIVEKFTGYHDEGKNVCDTGGVTGTCFANQLSSEADGGCTEDGYTYYWQGGNASWAKVPYAYGTIGGWACGPSAVAMVVTALAQKFVTPLETAKIANERGYYAAAGSTDAVVNIVKDYGLKVEPIADSVEEINKALKSGKMIVTSVGPGSGLTTGGHFIAIRAVTSSGKWKLFDSSSYYNGNVYSNINDMEFEPAPLVYDMSIHSGGSYDISK